MENMPEEEKKRIEHLQIATDEIKTLFFRLDEVIRQMDSESPSSETITLIEKSLTRLIFSIEELGKKSGTIFANESLIKDSTELSKYFYQILLKLESVKETLKSKDRHMYEKHLAYLKRAMKSADYILSLFIGEMTAEITESLFKPQVEQNQALKTQQTLEKIFHTLNAITVRVERCEKKMSKMLLAHPYAYLDGDEATVLKEITLLHDENLAWIEPRFIEKKLTISNKRLNEILDDLTHYGILQNKIRGGTTVYKIGDNYGIDSD